MNPRAARFWAFTVSVLLVSLVVVQSVIGVVIAMIVLLSGLYLWLSRELLFGR